MKSRYWVGLLIAALCGNWAVPALADAGNAVRVGLATYFTAPKGKDKAPVSAPMRTDAMKKTAAQTNQWYSTLLFNPKPEPIYVQPITIKTIPGALEFALPSKAVIPTVRQDTEIHYVHADPIVISPVAFEAGPAKLAKANDWSIDITMANGADDMTATVAHGSPYAYLQLSRGDVRVRLPAVGERFGNGSDARVLALNIKGKAYALFGPTGIRWESVSGVEWIGRMPAGKTYLSTAAMPDAKPATLALFSRHAYSFIEGTKVEWNYDQTNSKVETTFKATTRNMEGPDNGTLLGLYPHHWFKNASVEGKLGPEFDTVRGKIKVLAANQFKTTMTYGGFVPHWPAIGESPRFAEFNEVLKVDLRKRRDQMPLKENKDNWRVSNYWQGKGLTRVTQLMAVAEQQGNLEGRDQLLALVKERMEFWFSGKSNVSYFLYDQGLGTMVSYPDEFFSVEQMNDHHFHYGYWIRAAAEIALRDPAWIAKDKWGGMVELLISDIATAERGRADFPFLRNFDPYEGHAWASGVGLGEWGNNQESSSEAVNAWAGLILWGEITGNKALRDLGVYMYSTEIEAINHYWFDIHKIVFPPEYKDVEASMIFGGKYAHNTWWTDEPRQIHGINLLPISTYSTYLGRDPNFVKANMASLAANTKLYKARGQFPPNPPPDDIWQDIFAKYAALADPEAALAQWNRHGEVELGDTRTHTLYWMLSLREMGTPDFSVTADTALYSVFRRPDGRKTYLAFNAGKSPLNVKFSDGKTLTVAPGALGRTQ
jgi:endoglucanase Acf2